MGFLRLNNPHHCNYPNKRPDGSLVRVGDVWQCDECQRAYKLKSDQRDGDYWSQLTESERFSYLGLPNQ